MKLEQAIEFLARLRDVEEIPVSEAARRLKKTPFWVHQNFKVIRHSKKSHHVKLSDIEAYQKKRTVSKRDPTFYDLAVGDQFRLPTGKGYVGDVFVKTGGDTYGLMPGQPRWTWTGRSGFNSVELVREAA